MLLKIEVQDGLLVATLTGKMSNRKVLQRLKEICKAAAEKESRKVLIDCLGLTGELSEVERYEVAVEVLKYLSKLGINPKIAFVGEPPSVEGFGIRVAQNRGAHVALFSKTRTAMDWLKGSGSK